MSVIPEMTASEIDQTFAQLSEREHVGILFNRDGKPERVNVLAQGIHPLDGSTEKPCPCCNGTGKIPARPGFQTSTDCFVEHTVSGDWVMIDPRRHETLPVLGLIVSDK